MGLTPLAFSVWFRYPSIVKILLDLGADPNGHDNDLHFSPLHIAVSLSPADWVGCEPIARALLDYGSSMDLADGDGDTALHHACMDAQVWAVNLLLALGADISLRSISGKHHCIRPSGLATGKFCSYSLSKAQMLIPRTKIYGALYILLRI
jgi:ankyrin repeat protein